MLDITKTSLALRSNLDTDFKNSDAPISKNVRKIKEEYINHIHTYIHRSAPIPQEHSSQSSEVVWRHVNNQIGQRPRPNVNRILPINTVFKNKLRAFEGETPRVSNAKINCPTAEQK